ncbi:MAG: Fic family protein [Acidobacteria bacterium]|nr:Fic family protein [Acidobacteriota bacterium]MYJ05868.1 Fic family protein [Acidobacteriota bacterium]
MAVIQAVKKRDMHDDAIWRLIQIEASREAALNLVLPPDWRVQLDRLKRVRAIHGTTALEGNPLSDAAVGRQMDAMASSTTPPSGQSGRLRTHPVVVGTEALGGVHRGAPPEDVSRLVDEFVEFVHSRAFMANHPVVRALLAHFFLVTIHPFGDGNGRVSRLVEAGILYQGNYNVFGFYGLSDYFYRHGDEYKRLLQHSRRTQPFDLNAFVGFGVEGFATELKGINNFIKTKLNRVVYRATLLDFLLHETEPVDPFTEAPSQKIDYSELRDAPYVKSVYRGVTTRTFYRELTRLAETGFIKFSIREREPTVEIDFGAIGRY